jgi:phage terminase small subunit
METFARQYIALQFNGKHAAIAAGYSKKTAEATASRMLRNSKVKALVAKFGALVNKKHDFSVERTLTEIARCAFVRPPLLFRSDGTLKRLDELDEDTAAAIAGVEVGARGKLKKVKLTDKLRALELLARYHKLFSEDRTPMDLGVKVIVLDMPRPLRQVGAGAAALPASNGHKNGSGPHDE